MRPCFVRLMGSQDVPLCRDDSPERGLSIRYIRVQLYREKTSRREKAFNLLQIRKNAQIARVDSTSLLCAFAD